MLTYTEVIAVWAEKLINDRVFTHAPTLISRPANTNAFTYAVFIKTGSPHFKLVWMIFHTTKANTLCRQNRNAAGVRPRFFRPSMLAAGTAP